MPVSFCCVCFSFLVLSHEIGWDERLRNDLFCVGWDQKTLTQSIKHHRLRWCIHVWTQWPSDEDEHSACALPGAWSAFFPAVDELSPFCCVVTDLIR